MRSSPPTLTVGDIGDRDRDAVAGGDGGAADLVDMADAGIGADQERLAAALDEVGADRDVRLFERLGQLGEGDAIGGEPARVGLDDELLLVAADANRSPATPSTVRSCGRTTQSWMVRR